MSFVVLLNNALLCLKSRCALFLIVWKWWKRPWLEEMAISLGKVRKQWSAQAFSEGFMKRFAVFLKCGLVLQILFFSMHWFVTVRPYYPIFFCFMLTLRLFVLLVWLTSWVCQNILNILSLILILRSDYFSLQQFISSSYSCVIKYSSRSYFLWPFYKPGF